MTWSAEGRWVPDPETRTKALNATSARERPSGSWPAIDPRPARRARIRRLVAPAALILALTTRVGAVGADRCVRTRWWWRPRLRRGRRLQGQRGHSVRQRRRIPLLRQRWRRRWPGHHHPALRGLLPVQDLVPAASSEAQHEHDERPRGPPLRQGGPRSRHRRRGAGGRPGRHRRHVRPRRAQGACRQPLRDGSACLDRRRRGDARHDPVAGRLRQVDRAAGRVPRARSGQRRRDRRGSGRADGQRGQPPRRDR